MDEVSVHRERKVKRRPPKPMQFVRRFRQPGPVLDPGNDPAHKSSRSLRLVRKLPVVLINSPERVVLNGAFALTGLSAFVADTGDGVVSAWPTWVLFGFAFAMIGGGISVLVGMFRAQTSIERLGYVLVAPACLLYGVTALYLRGLVGVPVFLIFLGLAVAKAIRLIISSAERDMTIEYGERLDREVKARDEQAS